MIKDLDRWVESVILNDSDSLIESLMGMWLTMLLIFLTLATMPLWVVPYLIIKHRRKENESL